jgi:serine/threonine protein kinase
MDNYTIIKFVSSGSFGKIYKATSKKTHKVCAIKKIQYAGLSKYDKESTFNEAKITSLIKFPHLIGALDMFSDSEYVYIVYPYYGMKDLRHYLKGHPALSEEEIWKIMGQLVSAVSFLHKYNIIHRDIKIQNILVKSNLDVVLADLGVCKILPKYSVNTNTQVGTPYYLSPEIVEGAKYSKTTDIWSLGVLLYELIYKKYPFTAHNLPYLMKQIKMDNIMFPPTRYSFRLTDLCKKMLDKNQYMRPSADHLYSMPSLQRYIVPLPNIDTNVSNMLQNYKFDPIHTMNRNIKKLINNFSIPKESPRNTLDPKEFVREYFLYRLNRSSVGVQVNTSTQSDILYR